MSTLLGEIGPFDQSVEEWPSYVERLEEYFEANGITGDGNAAKRRAVLISVVGPKSYTLLRNLVAPTKPKEKTFEELVAALTEHYSPRPSEVMQRYRFNTRSRQPGESVADYVAELRRLAEFCEFCTTLDKMLRDRLVCGVNDESIQKKLLVEKNLTFARALLLAQGTEEAAKNLREMKAPSLAVPPSADGAVGIKQEEVNQVGEQSSGNKGISCHRCGVGTHMAPQCPHKDKVCHQCGKTGHLQRVCRSRGRIPARPRGRRSLRPVHYLEGDNPETDEEVEDYPVHHICTVKSSHPPIKVPVGVDGCMITMEVDTGASLSLMAQATFSELWPGRSLDKSEVKLQGYSQEPIKVVGSTAVKVTYEGQTAQLPLIVVEGNGPTLLGRNWLQGGQKVQLDWKNIFFTQSTQGGLNTKLQDILTRYQEVFKEGLGTYKGGEVRLDIDPKATPRFFKARSVPYAMREKVEQELDRLAQEGNLEPVDHSEWAAPIVPVLKSDWSSVRICGDFRLTVNPVSNVNRYPLPRVEDLFAKLQGGLVFTKIDLSQAYQQLPLDAEARKLVVINTQKGLFRYTRLPYGIASAPGIFQRLMDNLMQGIPGVAVFLDDICVTGTTEEEHLMALEEVLKRLAQAGLRARKKKCAFMAPSIEYLGYRIDARGLHPLPDKVKAVAEAPTPRNVTELKSYLGLLSYYGKFLPNLSTHLAPLYHLLGKDVPWTWSTAQKKAFQQSKQLLTSSKLLVHFNPELPITLACDASAYGVGAVLAHKMPDGTEQPIGYASRTLNKAERNYAQLEKEGLACIFGVKRFYSYLFGRPFELITDHKPLLGLLGEHKPTSVQASARVRRWSLYLSMFDYCLKFRSTTAHANADALSRLPLPVEPVMDQTPPELVLLAEHLAESPVTARQIKIWTAKDPVLARVVQFLQQGWPCSVQSSPELEPYFTKKDELSLYEGCILWGTRVVVPTPGREAVLIELHEGHPGIVRMKGLSRMYVWWPGIGKDIEQTVRGCTECQLNQSSPPVAPLHPWSWPTRPWARLHLDYAGPIQGRMYLVLIDAHSKWIEAFQTASATSAAVIEELRTLFAQFGVPETLVTDNGTCFVSTEFKAFLKSNGIQQLTSAPYHPASNGLAERAVQIVKKGLKKLALGTPRARLAKTLMAYRLTPQSTTGVSPAELLLGRRPRSRLDLLKPHTAERVESKQQRQKEQHDSRARKRNLEVGEEVFVRNYHQGNRWLPGVISQKTGPVSFRVKLADGRERRCHQDQLRKRTVQMELVPEVEDVELPVETDMPSLSEEPPEALEVVPTPPDDPTSAPQATPVSMPPQARVYPQRVRKQRSWYEPHW